MKADSGRGKGSFPSLVDLFERGEYESRMSRAISTLESCTLCPRECGVDRTRNETGICGVGRRAVVSAAHPHFGEESPLVGWAGSGTVFFSGCNLKCVFCQNYEISQLMAGAEVSSRELASHMLGLQKAGCHNLNLVSPTHVVPQILEALEIAFRDGLRLPIVYNTGGYDSLETLRLLDGIVDIYMPDVKYLSPEPAKAFSNAGDYPPVIKAALKEMHRQVGDLDISEEGLAVRGLLVRHLVLPGFLEDTRRIVRFLAGEISRETYVNIMQQYHPEFRAGENPPLDRPLSTDEWMLAVGAAVEAGLSRLDRRTI